jgi:preprotein translocase subunit SecD
VIAVLCVVCTVPFNIPGTVDKYLSVVGIIDQDAAIGGGYTVVYYPDGVISAEEYEQNSAAYANADEKAKYVDKYLQVGAICLEKDSVLDDNGNVSESFKTAFAADVQALKERFEKRGDVGTRVEVVDEYTIRVTLPSSDSNAGTFLQEFSYTGNVMLAYSDESSELFEAEDVSTYIKSASSRVSQDTAYVVIKFTKEGKELLYTTTADASDSSSTLYFKVGDTSVISLTVSSQIDQDTLYISGSYTADTAEAVAILINQSLNGTQTELALTLGDVLTYENGLGANTLMFLYIAYGVLFVAMVAFFLIRYHLLGFAHLYGYLAYMLSMILCLGFISFLGLGVGTVAAIVLTSVLLCGSNVVVFEQAKKEYALGKTISSSVKTGYQKTFWKIFDLHIALALAAFLTYAIAVSELQIFAFVLGLGTIFSGVCVLLVTRFVWYITMDLNKNKGTFCNFKGEDVDDE